jgi:hypothetical protein
LRYPLQPSDAASGGSALPRQGVFLLILVVLCLLVLPLLYATRGVTSLVALVPDPVVGNVGLVGSLVAGFSGLFASDGVTVLIAPVIGRIALAGRRRDAALAVFAFAAAHLLDRFIKMAVTAQRPIGDPGFTVAGLPGWIVPAAIGVLLLAGLRGDWRRPAFTTAAILATLFMLTTVVDSVIHLTPDYDGFPSGHATGSMSVAEIVVAFGLPKRHRIEVAFGLAVLVLGVGI